MLKVDISNKKYSVYTNEILPNIILNYHKLFLKYYFCWVYIEEKNYKTENIEISKIIKEYPDVLATYSYHNENIKYLMLKKDVVLPKLQNRLQKIINFKENNKEWILYKLLANAVFANLIKKNKKRKAFITNNSYCRVLEIKKIEKNDKIYKQLICIAIQITVDWKLYTEKNSPSELPLILDVTTKSFIIKDYIEDLKNEEFKKKCLAREAVIAKDFDFILPANKKNKSNLAIEKSDVFIPFSFYKRKNNTTAMIVNHDGKTRDPSNTRSGMLYKFIEDFNKIYKGIAKIKFKKIIFDHCYSSTKLNTDKDKEYLQILQELQKYPIKIINKSSKNMDFLMTNIKNIYKEYSKLNITAITEQQLLTSKNLYNEIVLLITKNKREYKSEIDDYIVLKKKYPHYISQSCFYPTLVTSNKKGNEFNKSAFDCILKEIIYKLEVKFSKCIINHPELVNDAKYILPVRVDSSANLYDDINEEYTETDEQQEQQQNNKKNEIKFIYVACTVNNNAINFEVLDEKQQEEIKEKLKDNKDLVFGRLKDDGEYNTNRNPLMMLPNNRYIIFTRTSIRILPNYIEAEKERKKLAKDRVYCKIPTEYLKKFISNETFNKPKLCYTISTLLKNKLHQPEFSYQEITTSLQEKLGDIYILKELKNNFETIGISQNKITMLQKLNNITGKIVSNQDKKYLFKCLERDFNKKLRNMTKSKDYEHLTIHNLGFNASSYAQAYYAGKLGPVSSDSQSKFCILYKLIHNFENELPECIYQSMLSFSVRHKQTTVYPFIFKHLAEYARQLSFSNNNDTSKNKSQNKNKLQTKKDFSKKLADIFY